MTTSCANRPRDPMFRMAAFGLLFLASGGSALAQKTSDLSGLWQTETAGSTVRIVRCGNGYCGTIAATAGPGVDAKNPDPALRSKPLVGLALLSGFSDAGDIWKGTIYDPESGKSYTSKVSRNGDGTLKVQGCIAFFCKTQTWTPLR